MSSHALPALSSEYQHTDQELLNQIALGSEDAFAKLFQRYWRKLYMTASRKLADAEQASEVIHDVFLEIWRRRETLYIDNVPAYLGKSLHNRILNELARKKDTFLFNVLEHAGASLYAADQGVLEKDLIALISTWIEALPEKRRKIFVRYYFQHLTTSEIASQLDISEKTVRNQLSISVQFLRVRFGHLLPVLLLLEVLNGKG
ncbi:RNA polymerase sigma factor [Chitinophaga parva]|uniref:RNA polymerase sigma factor n=1 Tax=Chitinophaga parva TaxID=2169414 RepID=UPI001F0C1FE8|nr:sigma-70 family RNA polymerase sigma factor [Chitinophaga parva]